MDRYCTSSKDPPLHFVKLVQQCFSTPLNPDVLSRVSSVTIVPLGPEEEIAKGKYGAGEIPDKCDQSCSVPMAPFFQISNNGGNVSGWTKCEQNLECGSSLEHGVIIDMNSTVEDDRSISVQNGTQVTLQAADVSANSNLCAGQETYSSGKVLKDSTSEMNSVLKQKICDGKIIMTNNAHKATNKPNKNIEEGDQNRQMGTCKLSLKKISSVAANTSVNGVKDMNKHCHRLHVTPTQVLKRDYASRTRIVKEKISHTGSYCGNSIPLATSSQQCSKENGFISESVTKKNPQCHLVEDIVISSLTVPTEKQSHSLPIEHNTSMKSVEKGCSLRTRWADKRPGMQCKNDVAVIAKPALIETVSNNDERWQIPPNMCRICAKTSDSIEYIFSEKAEKLRVLDMIHNHLPVKVAQDDLLPLHVCRVCISHLQVADKLVRVCKEADNTLRTLLNLVCNAPCTQSKVGNSHQDSSTHHSTVINVCELSQAQNILEDCDSKPVDNHEPTFECFEEKTSDCNERESKLSSPTESNSPGMGIKDSPSLAVQTEEDNQLISQLLCKQDINVIKDMKAEGLRVSLVRLPKLSYLSREGKRDAILKFIKTLKTSSMLEKKRNTRTVLIAGPTISSVTSAAIDAVGSQTNALSLSPSEFCENGDKNDLSSFTSTSEKGSKSVKKRQAVTLESCDSPQITDVAESEVSTNLRYDEEDLSPSNLSTRTCTYERTGQISKHLCDSSVHSIQGEDEAGKSDFSLSGEGSSKAAAQICKSPKKQIAIARQLARKRERNRLKRLSRTISCADCNFVAFSREEVRKHKLNHLQCKFCQKYMKTRAQLAEHERIHTKEKPFVCDQCGLAFRTKPQLIQHAQRHNPETPYSCEICGQRFSVRTTYTAHVMRHSKVSPFLCEICGKSFKLQAALRIHKFAHRSFCCTICNKTLSYKAFQLHKKTHSGEVLFPCPVCNKHFVSNQRLKIHSVIHEAIYPYSCGLCHRSFKRMTHLQAHCKRHSDEPLRIQSCFECAVCKGQFCQAGELSKHVQSHTDQERGSTEAFKCEACNKCFSLEHELHSHTIRLCGKKMFSCSVCVQSFNERTSFDNHSTDHIEEKPFACDICGKRFATLLNLNNHLAIHLTVKPHSCPFCEKSFKTINGLNQHKTVHSDIRKYSCNLCSMSFKRCDALRNHKRTHFSERPFACSVCGKSFKVKSDCLTHLRRHRESGTTGSVIESYHSCPVCQQTFSLTVDLSNHMSASHEDSSIPDQNGQSLSSVN